MFTNLHPSFSVRTFGELSFEYAAKLCPAYILRLPPDPDLERIPIRAEYFGDILFGGTDADEEMFGSRGDDTFFGSFGSDHMRGGQGRDTADYSGSPCGVYVDLEQGFGAGSHAAGDLYTNIENVRGSDHADTLIGKGNDNALFGGRGDDWLDGRRGADSLDGWRGNDTLIGGTGDDTLVGGTGDDVLRGGPGADTFKSIFVGGTDVVEDFDLQEDTLHLVGFGGYQMAMGYFSDVNGDAVLTRVNNYLNYTHTLVIENITVAELTEDLFIFS